MPLLPTSVVQPVHLGAFNRLPVPAAVDLVRACLEVPRWWCAVVSCRPYHDYETLLEVARDAAYPLSTSELEAAVAHHLRRRRPADARPLGSRAPQDDQGPTWGRLTDDYRQKFGRPFIARAAGRSTDEITGLLTHRLDNTFAVEDAVVAAQLRQIALLALTRRIGE